MCGFLQRQTWRGPLDVRVVLISRENAQENARVALKKRKQLIPNSNVSGQPMTSGQVEQSQRAVEISVFCMLFSRL